MTDVVLRVRDLHHAYPAQGRRLWGRGRRVPAVEGVSFDLPRGQTLALVGESGCGKSTVARAILRLVEPSAGEVLFAARPGEGPVDVLGLNRAQLRRLRPRLQMVFQDPWSSLNPRLSVRRVLGELLLFHRVVDRGGLEPALIDLLSQVGLDADALDRFPHEFSGGERQRIAIARALAPRPTLLIADEPTSALDVSVQAQVLNLLARLKVERGLSYLFISHDLSIVRHVADRVAVMYLGQIVESGTREDIFERPAHPYTRALLGAIPTVSRAKAGQGVPLRGEVPSSTSPPSGCRFRSRCPLAEERCRLSPPEVSVRPGHRVHCHLSSPVEGDREESTQR